MSYCHWHQAIIWTSAGLLLIGPLGTNFDDILIYRQEDEIENVLKISAILSQPPSQ